MDTTPTPPSDAPARPPAGPDVVDALALVRRIRDDFAARTAGLSADELIAFVRREAAALEPSLDKADTGQAAA